MRLKNKTAIVTGAADGLGLVIAQTFAKEGATVAMCDINGEKCREESAQINSAGGSALAVECSVGDTEQMQAMVNQVMATYGQIDVLVNNAAVAISGKVTEMPEERWDTLMNINLKGVFRGIQLVMPHMLERRSGSIINMSSTQATRSWDNWTAYAAAKGAINAITNQLAGQFGKDGIRINAISPGAIMTPMNAKRVEVEGDGFLKGSIGQAAMLRMGKPEEVAYTAVFLASDEAPFITGENIVIDGGLSALPRYFEQ